MRSIDTRASLPGLRIARAVVLIAGLTLSGCYEDTRPKKHSDEAENIPTAPLSGRIVAPITSGLHYTSGTLSGVTDAEGRFRYEHGQPVQFTAAGVKLPPLNVPETKLTTRVVNDAKINDGPAVTVTPSDLSDNPAMVVNATRFMMMLDADGDATNGVQIGDAARARTATPLDWTTPDVEAAAAIVRSEVISLDGGAHRWPDEAEAVAFHAQRRACAITGRYAGRLIGESTTTTTTTPTNDNLSGSNNNGQPSTTTTVITHYANMNAIVMAPALTVAGFATLLRSKDDTLDDGNFLFNMSGSPTPGSGVVLSTNAALHQNTDDWPTADPIESSPPMQLSVRWSGNRVSGSWDVEGRAGGEIEAYRDDTDFYPVYRFVQFPVAWRHNLGWTMYGTLIVEIDSAGVVLANFFNEPSDASPNIMRGSVSGDTVEAIDPSTNAFGYSWKFTGTLDREAMTLTGTLYQWDGLPADEFTDDPIVGCAL